MRKKFCWEFVGISIVLGVIMININYLRFVYLKILILCATFQDVPDVRFATFCMENTSNFQQKTNDCRISNLNSNSPELNIFQFFKFHVKNDQK
jgi:hypothetical protein